MRIGRSIDAATSIERPIIFDIHKRLSSGASTLQEEMTQRDVAVEISGHVTQENQNLHQTYESETNNRKFSLFYLLYVCSYTNKMTQMNF